MVPKSTIETLPEDVLGRLNSMIGKGRFTVDQLAGWLDEQGHTRSRSAVGRHSKGYRFIAAELRQSREITEALVAELGEAATQGKQGRLLVEMVRSLVFKLLVKLQKIEASDENVSAIDSKDVQQLGKGLAELGRALRFDQDFEEKIRKQVQEEERAAAAGRAETAIAAASVEHGFKLPPEALRTIREQIYGIVEKT